MDSLSSADLDTTSKTPMFVGIAGIIIGIAGAILGWLGFSKASILEAELSQVSESAASVDDLRSQVDQAGLTAERSSSDVQSLREAVNTMSEAIAKDMSGVKKDMRSIAIQAGTALKKLEAIEKGGLKSARASSGSTTSTTRSNSQVKPSAPEGTEIYTIKKGDMLYRVAAKFNVSLDEITAANPGIDINRLQIGQEIIVPKK